MTGKLFVQRDASGKIVGLSTQPDQTNEAVPPENPEVQEFLATSDLGLVRVLEDLIDLLVDKQLICFTDLPQAAQRKLLGRKTARSYLNRADAFLVDQDDLL